MLHTKYKSTGLCSFREENFFQVFPTKRLCQIIIPPGAWPVWTPGAWLAGFIKRTTSLCYAQNVKALGLAVSEKKIFSCLPTKRLCQIITPPGRGQFGPQGHGWQDL